MLMLSVLCCSFLMAPRKHFKKHQKFELKKLINFNNKLTINMEESLDDSVTRKFAFLFCFYSCEIVNIVIPLEL